MGIRLPTILNETPDSVKEIKGDESSDEVHTETEYTWRFRHKDELGLDVVLSPLYTGSGEWEWDIELYAVEWTGDDFIVETHPRDSITKDDFSQAVSCAGQTVKSFCNNNSVFSHIVE